MFGKIQDKVFKAFKKLLKPFGIKRFYSDNWGSYSRHLNLDKYV